MLALRKIKDIVIYGNDEFHSAMPSAISISDDEILVAFRRAPDRRQMGFEKVTHIDPNSQLMACKSRDAAESWSDLQLICSHPLGGLQDPCLFKTGSGKILCSSYLWTMTDKSFPSAKSQIAVPGYVMNGGVLLDSEDNGNSWSQPRPAPKLNDNVARDIQDKPLPLFNRGSMAEDESGRIYWSVTCHRNLKPQQTSIELMVSDDDGRNWQHFSTIAESEKIVFNEASLLFTPSGDLCCFIRTFRNDDRTVLAISKDRGRSFDRWQNLPWRGSPHHALNLKDGRILVAYGYRWRALGIRARVIEADLSDASTAEEIIIRDDGGSWDLGYPWSVQLSDGELLIVYYMNIDDGPRHIAGSICELK